MVNFKNKLHKLKGLSAQDLLSYALIQGHRLWLLHWGSLCFRIKARCLGLKLGAGVQAHGRVLISRWPRSHMELGANCSLVSNALRSTAANYPSRVRFKTFYPQAKIILGQGVQLNGTAITVRSTSITLGDETMIAPGCVLVDSDFHAPWPAETRQVASGLELDAPIHIGKQVWIGMNCIILKGVSIGDGAIIGAGSVVTRSIPAGCVAVGVPARVVQAAASQD